MYDTQKNDRDLRLKKGQRVALTSTFLVFLLACLKAVVGYRYNSPLLIADAYHSGADILINITSLIGLWLASRKKSTRFPYGLYRAETMACLVIGGCIVFIGYELFTDGWHKRLLTSPPTHFPYFPMGAALLSCIVSVVLMIEQRTAGKMLNSQALLTTSREAFFDIFTSLFVLAGLILVYLRIPYVETIVISIISIFIIKLGLEAMMTSLLILLDANLDIELQTDIEEKINQFYGVKGVGEVKIRQSGPFRMIECVIKTSPSLPLYKAHEMADKVENVLYRDYDSIESAFIHVEPESKHIETALLPVQNIDGLNSTLDAHFGRAPYFIIVNLTKDRITIEDFYLNEFLDEKGHIGLNVAKEMISHKIDVLVVAGIGEIAFHMLKNHYVDIYKADSGFSITKIFELYRINRLHPITEPTHSVNTAKVAAFSR